ncbi:MAG: hypothetical protein AB1724_10810 [Thermodesulfobacteriota bacterium]
MKTSRLKIIWFLLLLVFCLLITGCGIHHNVKGRVVDATTGDPIEGASIAISWTGTKIGALFAPYADGTYILEEAKDTSNKDGYFSIPKYFLKSFSMGVYKKGYVCWDAKNVFLQGEPIKITDQYGTRTSDDVKERTGFKVRNGMVIELEPFTATARERLLRHAQFTDSLSGEVGGLDGIGEEIEMVMEDIQKKKEALNKKEKQEKAGAPK